MIGSGESLAFDGHLVDIQEPEGDHKPPVDLKVEGRNCTASCRTGLSDGQETHRSSIGMLICAKLSRSSTYFFACYLAFVC